MVAKSDAEKGGKKMKARNPTDATQRNTRAANKKLQKLADEVKDIKKRVKKLEKDAGSRSN